MPKWTEQRTVPFNLAYHLSLEALFYLHIQPQHNSITIHHPNEEHNQVKFIKQFYTTVIKEIKVEDLFQGS